MKEVEMENEKMLSLNSIVSEFDVEKLEDRLETDPLAIGGLLDLASTQDLSQSVSLTDNCEGNCGGIIAINRH